MTTVNKESNFIRNLNQQLVRKDPVLNLSYERMGDAGIAFICQSKNLYHVKELDLSWNEISDLGLQKLADCSWAVTCSKSAYNYLKARARDDDDLSLVYHGLDLSRFSDHQPARSARNGSEESDPVILLTVGRAVEKKGHDILISALALLPKEVSWRE